MDDLLSLLVIVFTVVGMINKSKKKKEQQAKSQKVFQEMPPVTAPQAVPQQPAAAPAATMMPPRPEHKTVTPLEAMIKQVVRETKGESKEGRTDHSAHISCEGHDPCHEDQLSPAVRPARVAVQETAMAVEEEGSSLKLNFTGDEMVRAVVMQEILTRPCDRRRRAV